MEEEYIIQCWACIASFDAFSAGWCAHIPPSKICPYCLRCSCNAPEEYKKEIWKNAPYELVQERESVSKGKEPLGEMLLRSGKITHEILQAALKRQEEEGVKLGEILVKMNVIKKEELELYLISQKKIPAISLKDRKIDFELVRKISLNFCFKHKCLPLGIEEFKDEKILALAMTDPFDSMTISTVSSITNLRVIPYQASQDEIGKVLNEVYEAFEVRSPAGRDGKDYGLIKELIKSGIRRGAEEIYIEPHDTEFRIFFRIEGYLFKSVPLPKNENPNLINFIMELANLDVNISKVPQKGKMNLGDFNENYEIYVVSTPSRAGNIITIKLIDKEKFVMDLPQLGLTELDIKDIKDAIGRKEGLIIVSAPLFNNSSSTLYSFMSSYLNEGWRVTSIEPLIYMEMPGITQVEYDEKLHLSYVIKKAVDTQPEILFIFSFHDENAINLLIHYSINFPVVVEMNARNAVQVIHILRDMMGVNPKILSERLNLIMNQRMVRRLCDKCKEPAKAPFDLDLKIVDMDTYEFTFYKEKGCEECNRTGFKGRFPIYEILKITSSIKELIAIGANERIIREAAKKSGFITLGQNCIYKIIQGLTSTTEYLKGGFD
ncbi:MAG: GspE/PulE family protein [Candidatus Aminicenantia bacterium]